MPPDGRHVFFKGKVQMITYLLSITEESHIPISDPVRPLSTDAASEGEALTVIINGCKVTINNHAGRDVIYHTISALRKL